SSRWAYRDVIEVVEVAGRDLDVIVLPKVSEPAHVSWLDLLLGQIEQAMGHEPGRIGIEAQIEDAKGLADVDAIAGASPRLEALVFGPADFMGNIGMRSLQVGAEPAGYTGGDAYHYARMRILVAARAHGLAAIDGPHLAIRDLDGLARAAKSAAALGYDGKWALHPAQIDAINEAFSPSQDEYERAELILDAYEHATTVRGRGAVMLGDEMIDEASRKLALVAAAKGPGARGPRGDPNRAPPIRAGAPAPAGAVRGAALSQPSTPQAVSASISPPVTGRLARSATVTQRASAASSPAASSPPVTVTE